MKVIGYIFDFFVKIAQTACSMSKEMEEAIKAIKNAKSKGASREWLKILKKRKKNLMKPSALGVKGFSTIASLISIVVTIVPYLPYLKKIKDGLVVLAEFVVDLVIEIIGWAGDTLASLIGKLIPYAGFLIGWALGIVVGIIISNLFHNQRIAKIKRTYAKKVKNSNDWRYWLRSLVPSIGAAF